MRRVMLVLIVLAVAFAAAQLIRTDGVNPPTDAGRTIRGQAGTPVALGRVLGRSCDDCHSNDPVWPRYARVAPLSWLLAYAVREGRRAVNFSEWTTYSPERQRKLLDDSCRAVRMATMPGSAWTALHAEARLSPQDVEAICSAARKGTP